MKRILLCGPSGSGKTFIARALREMLKDQTVFIIDGDEIRQTLSKNLTFTPEDVRQNMINVGELANLLEIHGGVDVCIAAVIAGKKDSRHLLTHDYHFQSFFVSRPECKTLDLKGLYKAGLYYNFEPDDELKFIDNTLEAHRTPQDLAGELWSALT